MIEINLTEKNGFGIKFLDKRNYHLFFWPSGYGGDFLSSLYHYHIWTSWWDKQNRDIRENTIAMIEKYWDTQISVYSYGDKNQIRGNTYRVKHCYKTKENNRPPELKDKIDKDWWKPNTNLVSGHWESDFVDAFDNLFFIENNIKFTNNYRIVCSPDSHWKRFLIDLAYIKKTSGDVDYNIYEEIDETNNNWKTTHSHNIIEYQHIYEDYGWQELFSAWGHTEPPTPKRHREIQTIVQKYHKRNKKIVSQYHRGENPSVPEWSFPPFRGIDYL